MIAIKCPSCQADYTLASELAGRKVQCEFCREKFRVPESANVQSVDIENKSSAKSNSSSSRIDARCPRCLADYKLAARYAGQSVRCRDCKSIFKVADPNPVAGQPQNTKPEPIDDDLLEDVTPAHFFNTTAPVSATQPNPKKYQEPEGDSYDVLAGNGDISSNNFNQDDDDRRMMRAAARKASQPAAGQADWESFRPAPIKKKPKFETDTPSFFKRLMGGILVVLLIGLRGWLKFERRQARLRNAPRQAAPAEPVGQQFPMLDAMRQQNRARFENGARPKTPPAPPPVIPFVPPSGPPAGANRFPVPKKPEEMLRGPNQGRLPGPPGQPGRELFF